MAKTTYKVGDKVRILDSQGICAGFDLDNGKEYPISKIDSDGDIYVIDGANDELLITKRELKYIEKVAEQVAKFKVGDIVKANEQSNIKYALTTEDNGFTGEVVAVDKTGKLGIRTLTRNDSNLKTVFSYLEPEYFELVSSKPTKNQRLTSAEQAISTLEQKVEALKAEIDALKATQKPPVTVIADAIKRYKERTPNEQASANEKRKAIIDEAKAFVKNTEQRAGAQFYKAQGDSTKRMLTFKYEVNADKRTVVALGFGSRSNTLRGKGIAKCAPDDVFNADIGKAIALGRALGLDVSKFEKAVQPSEVVVGQVVKGREETGRSDFEASVTSMFPSANGRGHGAAFHHSGGLGRLGEKRVHIIDDTEAKY